MSDILAIVFGLLALYFWSDAREYKKWMNYYRADADKNFRYFLKAIDSKRNKKRKQ